MQNTPGQTGIATVAAGSTVGFKADNTMGELIDKIATYEATGVHRDDCPQRPSRIFLGLHDQGQPSGQLSLGRHWQDLVQDLGMGTDVQSQHGLSVCIGE
jgi:hypothetical protein